MIRLLILILLLSGCATKPDQERLVFDMGEFTITENLCYAGDLCKRGQRYFLCDGENWIEIEAKKEPAYNIRYCLTPKKSMNQQPFRSELRNFEQTHLVDAKLELAKSLMDLVKREHLSIAERRTARNKLHSLIVITDNVTEVLDRVEVVKLDDERYARWKALHTENGELQNVLFNELRSELRAEGFVGIPAPKEDPLDKAEALIKYVEREALRAKDSEGLLTQLLQSLRTAHEIIVTVDLTNAGLLRVNRVQSLRREHDKQFHVVTGYLWQLSLTEEERKTVGRSA